MLTFAGRPIRILPFIFAVAGINAVLYQWPLYGFVAAQTDLSSTFGWLILLSVFLITFLATAGVLFLLTLISWRLLKPLLMILALTNAVAVYFMHTYGVILDKAMMGNVFHTQSSEASELFHINLLFYMLVLGVLPVLGLLRVRLQPSRWLRGKSLLSLIVVTLSLGAWIYAASSTWLWFDKHAKQLGGMVLPWSYVANTVRFHRATNRNTQRQLLPDASAIDANDTVVVLVIGETARAHNFALYGYERDTNPKLMQQAVTVFGNTRACTTYTTGSLACMLSHDISNTDFETLPTYLHRQHINVIWRTRNWGEPPITAHQYQKASELEKDCNSNNCQLDEVLLTGLAEQIATTSGKTLVVLHQRGSHGPSYFKEYPSDQAVFTPVCETVDLPTCTPQSIVNTYDNTIRYTDTFLHQTIEMLKTLDDRPTVMLYISDHGESLGEHGLYLHGTPYALAPDYQKMIPFLTWTSPAFIQQQQLKAQHMAQADAYGHQHIFHSVLGALGLRSDIYQPNLDVFAEGRK